MGTCKVCKFNKEGMCELHGIQTEILHHCEFFEWRQNQKREINNTQKTEQKEPEFVYVYYNEEMTHKYVSEISYKPNETHKNRIKVYLEDGRWDE